jgi:hypothetical protein
LVQDSSSSEDTFGQTKHGETDDIHEKLNSDTPNDESQESHVVENPVKEKEVSTEVLSAIGSNQNSIAEEFEFISENSDMSSRRKKKSKRKISRFRYLKK